MTSPITAILRLGMAILLLGGLYSCGSMAILFGDVPVTPISELQQARDANTTVYLKGTVGSLAPFLEGGAYQLQDATGSIWVVTDGALPAQGDIVKIKGNVTYQSIPIAGKELGEIYIKEIEQLQRQNTSTESK
ncbi:MAG: hypothetical protein N3E45_12860 [Oscillatoriaceae bacterium SKW80]|nr:hypothetical protein [Oscillatoriaceae bacterium SKYG93]MCX8121690.1 hypothetical protein [Oscillatoriaceae bacterium SKW80]MDW8453999.1 hypothetical protein [Oscillatoriaceae cyanobacterium SKYGB_i_bin93]HIK28757.1 hypothetical protein [Oscillatoriaceae cyanobacterium M7585_C2015_266]